MKYIKRAIILSIGYCSIAAYPQKPIVHDPVMIKQDSTYYLFCTDWGIGSYASTDMVNWQKGEPVFKAPPEWAIKAVPGYKGHTWAPDIAYYQGKYYLCYSVSAFGKNTSCIGLAENTTLHPTSPGYRWVDHGKIIQSVPGRDDWNAIDPNLIVDDDGHPWISFGSFWSGIKLVKLKDDLSGLSQPEEWYGLARRPRINSNEKDAGNGAIEAPFITKRGKYYYLFVSFDYCCRGINSNYKMMAGRSEKITGPYMDRQNTPMMDGGATLVLQGNKNWPGVGHCAIYNFNGKDYLVFHAYDASDNGKPKLMIRELTWDSDGWPISALE